jgi:hypothetical protein
MKQRFGTTRWSAALRLVSSCRTGPVTATNRSSSRLALSRCVDGLNQHHAM